MLMEVAMSVAVAVAVAMAVAVAVQSKYWLQLSGLGVLRPGFCSQMSGRYSAKR
jgi:hypothetical protein